MNLEESFEPQIIQTQDENGEVHNFELIDILTIDEQDYGMMIYLENEENPESEDQEVVVMRINKDENDNYMFEAIESEEEFNKVVNMLEEIAPEEEE